MWGSTVVCCFPRFLHHGRIQRGEGGIFVGVFWRYGSLESEGLKVLLTTGKWFRFISLTTSKRISPQKDLLFWKGDINGKFTVKEYFESLEGAPYSQAPVKVL